MVWPGSTSVHKTLLALLLSFVISTFPAHVTLCMIRPVSGNAAGRLSTT
jgi:hypothetical protein